MDNKSFFALVQQHHRLNAFAVLCQCHHETRVKGKPWSSDLFMASNNAAGIKAAVGWSGKVIVTRTWEQSPGGGANYCDCAFRSYGSIEDFIFDYEAKIAKMYPLCVARHDNFWGYFDGLLSGKYKWATDKEYMRRLAETAVRLAPEIFGADAAEAKLKTALLYAMEKGYISNANTEIVYEVLGIENAQSVKSRIICIDAGHGGKDPGACAGGIAEKDITLKVAKMVGAKLPHCNVIYTRTGDTYPTLAERTNMANSYKADILVSIHCNAAERSDAHGIETWIYEKASDVSSMIAQSIHNRLVHVSGMSDRGVKRGNLHVLRESMMPAVLVELGFISNQNDRANLMDTAWQQRAADAIVSGIELYVERI